MKLTDVTPNLIVSDIDRSTAFYRDVLGFSVVTTVPDAAPFVFAWMKRDDVRIHRYPQSLPAYARLSCARLGTRPQQR